MARPGPEFELSNDVRVRERSSFFLAVISSHDQLRGEAASVIAATESITDKSDVRVRSCVTCGIGKNESLQTTDMSSKCKVLEPPLHHTRSTSTSMPDAH
ncbi:hypothetical protein NPIL_427501 [Nephila pilipes]|uniref:Uncharacterized protein n=1 Tax=Nephila pilipes TaxID=299642 RepID=A0A8X6U9U2_NEPPI|nr:hypothetical protein NPIL_427501 [Nephila pilipes]